MSIYPMIAKNLWLPAIDCIYGSSVTKHLKSFEKSQFWDSKELRKYQLNKLKVLIKHAYSTVPFYRNYFIENGLKPNDFNRLEDLRKLPIVDKKIIADNIEAFISEKYDRKNLMEISTGGTTGRPFKSYTTNYSRSYLRAINIRAWEWAGYNYGDRKVTLAGSSLTPNEKVSLKIKLRNLVENNLPLSAAHVNDLILLRYVQQIRDHKPKMIRGYPSSVYLLARFVKNNSLDGVNPKIVVTTAEVLLKKHRKFIEEVFDCRVFDNYSNPESLANASECEHNNLHAGTDVSYIEIADTNHGVGKIIATDLTNYGMPIIRYNTEDLAHFSERSCECGRVLPVIDSLQGRSTDIISFSNGNSLGGPALTLIFQHFNLENYQIVQDRKDSLVINIVKSNKFQESEMTNIEDIMRYHCGKDVQIKMKVHSEILLEKGQKWRFIISKVN